MINSEPGTRHGIKGYTWAMLSRSSQGLVMGSHGELFECLVLLHILS